MFVSIARKPRNLRTRGFTLIELLVVVSIISLLVSISMPSLSRARQQAQGVVCMTSLYDINRSITAYAGMNDDRTPTLDYRVQVSGAYNGKYHSWAEAIYKFAYNITPDLNSDYPALTNRNNEYEYLTCKAGDPRDSNSDGTGNTGHFRVWKPGWSGVMGGQANLRVPILFDGVCDNESDVHNYGRTSPVVNPFRVTGGTAQPYDGRQADDSVIGIKERHYGGANYAFPDFSARRNVSMRANLVKDFDLDGTEDHP